MKTIRYYLLGMIGGTLIGYFGIFLIVEILSGKGIDFSEISNQLLSGGILALFIASGASFGLAYSIKPRIKYLESEATSYPSSPGIKEISIPVDNKNFDFQYYLNLLASEFVITHKHTNQNIVKLRSKFGWTSWGAGSIIEYDPKTGTLMAHTFPISGYTRKSSKNVKELNTKLKSLAAL